MTKRKLDVAIASISKTYSKDPTLLGSMNIVAETAQNLMTGNNVLRKKLRALTECLQFADTAEKRKEIILGLEELHHEHRCVDQYFVDIVIKSLKAVIKNIVVLEGQLAKDLATHNALDAKHKPSRTAKKMLWDEWETNYKKYSSKKDCALKNYDRIIEQTGASLNKDTFVRVLMKAERPAM